VVDSLRAYELQATRISLTVSAWVEKNKPAQEAPEKGWEDASKVVAMNAGKDLISLAFFLLIAA
jgi:hypothetical protein